MTSHQLAPRTGANPPAGRQGRRRRAALLAALFAPLAGVALAAPPASAVPAVAEINPGGGVQADGSDGIHFSTDLGSGTEQIGFANTVQYLGYGQALLSVGNALLSWSTITADQLTGSATDAGATSTGSGAMTLHYTGTSGGLTYTMDRTLSYTYPNNFLTDRYQFTIPVGNTAPVKYYLGGDTAPGSNDTGVGVLYAAPGRYGFSTNPVTHIQLGFAELGGSRPFDGLVSWDLVNVSPIFTGSDIGFHAQSSQHDAMLFMQWTLGSAPGTYTGAFRQIAGFQEAGLEASFRSDNVLTGAEATLDLALGNTKLTAENGNGFTFTLPTGLTVGSTAVTNACGGTVTAAPGATTIVVSGVDLAATSGCAISVPVGGADGSYSIGAASATGFTANLNNRVGTSTVTFGSPTPPPPPAAGSGYAAMTPARLLDTRDGGTLAAGVVHELVVAGEHGVAVDATSVVLDVAVTGPKASGYLTVYPCGGDVPLASNVNFVAGQTVANQVSVKIGTGGKVCFVSSAAADIVVDANGYHAPSAAGANLEQLTPARLVDTRDAGTPLAAGTPFELVVAGSHGVAADAHAAVLNVTVTEPSADGYLTVYPCGETMPLASSLNFVAGQTVPNAVNAKIGTDGKVCFFSNVATHLVVDVDAAYGPTGTGTFHELTPVRLVDSRQASALQAGAEYELVVADGTDVPAGAVAVALNVTATEPVAAGFVTVYPCGADVPLASNVNFVAGQTAANAVTATIGTGGKVCFHANVATHLVVDLAGWYGTTVV